MHEIYSSMPALINSLLQPGAGEFVAVCVRELNLEILAN